MTRRRSDDRVGRGETAPAWEQRGAAVARSTGRGGSRLRRLIFWILLVAGVVLLLLVVAAMAVGVWLVVNADAALAWVNGVFDQLRPIISMLSELSGGG